MTKIQIPERLTDPEAIRYYKTAVELLNEKHLREPETNQSLRPADATYQNNEYTAIYAKALKIQRKKSLKETRPRLVRSSRHGVYF